MTIVRFARAALATVALVAALAAALITPSWALIPTGDNIIPPASQRFMAGRSGAHTTEIAASHAVLVSQPDAVAGVVVAAAAGS